MTLRTVVDDDAEFVRAVYASTREAELAHTDWPEAVRAEFVRSQEAAQRADYERRFPNSEHSVIQDEGEDVGRIWVDRGPVEIRLLDIALLGSHRNRGIGATLVKELISEAQATGTPLRHTVFAGNEAALRFYSRLGFEVIEDLGVYLAMEWTGVKPD